MPRSLVELVPRLHSRRHRLHEHHDNSNNLKAFATTGLLDRARKVSQGELPEIRQVSCNHYVFTTRGGWGIPNYGRKKANGKKYNPDKNGHARTPSLTY
jgi:hypothetical protein